MGDDMNANGGCGNNSYPKNTKSYFMRSMGWGSSPTCVCKPGFTAVSRTPVRIDGYCEDINEEGLTAYYAERTGNAIVSTFQHEPDFNQVCKTCSCVSPAYAATLVAKPAEACDDTQYKACGVQTWKWTTTPMQGAM